MKNILHILSIIMIIGFSFLHACSKEESQSFSVGLVTDVGGIDDKAFNQSAWEGIEKFIVQKNLSKKQYTYVQSATHSDYLPNLSALADDGITLIVAAGFTFTDAVTKASQNFPDTQFLIVDTAVPQPNVVSAVFNEEQGSFLVGIIAGLQSIQEGKTKVGFIGGMEFDVIHRFEAGFEKGVKTVAPNLEILVEYAGDFSAPQIGQVLAAKMYNANVGVIFHAAATTGNGAIKEAKDRAINGEHVWIIGVDRDQYEEGIYGDGQSIILTSMVKRVDIATYNVALMAKEGKFPGGDVLAFSLKNEGVGIPEENPNVTPEFLDLVSRYKQKVLSDEIIVPQTPTRLLHKSSKNSP